MYWTLSKSVGWLARLTALVGGVALFAVVVMTCASITGRPLDRFGLGPIPGDIELVEFGIGFAVFAFMPYAQYAGAHARVDMLKRLYGRRLNRILDLIADLFLLAFAALVAWRLWFGMVDKGAYHETSFILQIPLVWGYRAAMVAAAVAVLTAAFCVLRSARILITGKDS